MTDNAITSDDVAPKKGRPAKATATTEKAVPKKKFVENKPQGANIPDGYKIVIFESGSSYTSNRGTRFTSKDRMKILPIEEVDALLLLDNFREPDALEVEEFNSKISEV